MTRKRERKAPGLYKLGSSRRWPQGCWELRYRGAFNETRRKTFATRAEAEDFKAKLRMDPSHADQDKRGKTPFAVVAQEWLTEAETNGGKSGEGVRPKTLAAYEDVLHRFLLPGLGSLPIGRITPNVLNEFKAGLRNHLSPTSRRAILRSLSPIFNTAVSLGYIATSPLAKMKKGWLPRANKRKDNILTPEHVTVLAEEVPERYRTLIYFAAYTGLRAGEIAALRRKNLSLKERRLTIESSMADVGGVLDPDGPTKNGETRTVPLAPFLVDLLREHLADRPHDREAFVFPGAQGGPFRHNNFYGRHFKPAVRRALPPELHGFRFHDLRHTCASWLIRSGAHPKEISEWLGHSTIAITMNIYGHLFPGDDVKHADALDLMFKSADAAGRSEGKVVEFR